MYRIAFVACMSLHSNLIKLNQSTFIIFSSELFCSHLFVLRPSRTMRTRRLRPSGKTLEKRMNIVLKWKWKKIVENKNCFLKTFFSWFCCLWIGGWRYDGFWVGIGWEWFVCCKRIMLAGYTKKRIMFLVMETVVVDGWLVSLWCFRWYFHCFCLWSNQGIRKWGKFISFNIIKCEWQSAEWWQKKNWIFV